MERERASGDKSITLTVPSGNPIMIVMLLLVIVGAFMLGTLNERVKRMESGTYAGVGGALGGTAGGTDTTGGANPQAPAAAPTAGPLKEITKDDHVKGNRNAKIALVEYSDLECPFCKSFHPTAQKVIDTYKDDVMWVYRHFPLSFHANAQKEAEASECANELGGNDAFWKYIDAIYSRTTANGTGFALDALVPLAGELGLDEGKFKTCLDSGKYAKKIIDEMAGGSSAGITGTPGIILLNIKTGETKVIPGAVPFEQISPLIDEMLKS